MRHPQVGWLACTLVAAGVWLGEVRPAQAAEAPLAGNWKVIVLERGTDITVWLVKLEGKDSKVKGTLLSVGLPPFKNSKLDKTSVDKKGVHLTLTVGRGTFAVTAGLPTGEKVPKKLLGSVAVGSQRAFIRLERTKLDELPSDPKKNIKDSPAKEAFNKAAEEEGDAKLKGLREVVSKYPSDPLAYFAGLQALSLLTEKKDARAADLRTLAQQTLKVTALYGPEMELTTIQQVVQTLDKSKASASVAVPFARQAEKLLPKDAPFAQRLPVLRTLATALDKAGKADEVKEVYTQIAKGAREAENKLGDSATLAQRLPLLKTQAMALLKAGKEDEAKGVKVQVAKIEDSLDKEFLKTAIPFKPGKYDGRKAKSDRVALVELFTGAQCPPCVAADIAFDAALKTYKPSDVIFLQYHLHIPGPDALTNKDSEARSKYYGSAIRGTPTAFIDGKQTPPLGGYRQHAKGSYERLRTAVDEQLEEPSQGKLKLTANRKGDTIDITAQVSNLKKTGDDVRLRFVLVQEVARYAGSNGQRLHHHVVRALPGGARGFALTAKASKQTASVNLHDLKKALNEYLSKQSFAEESRPLNLKNLKVVAFIQDDKSKTKEVLQAAQVDVPEEK